MGHHTCSRPVPFCFVLIKTSVYIYVCVYVHALARIRSCRSVDSLRENALPSNSCLNLSCSNAEPSVGSRSCVYFYFKESKLLILGYNSWDW